MTTDGAPPPISTPIRPQLPAAGQRRRLVLKGMRRQVAAGRDFGRQALLDWYAVTGGDGQEDTPADDVLLLISELLANAVMHAGGAHHILLHGTAETLRVEVADGDPAMPRPRAYQPGTPGGHGLHIVGRLADRWGVDLLADGKAVWLEVRAEQLTSGQRST
ncbi:ATP-binding protein [Kitasatospora sp. NPDC101801]|uniref:ATP-binding protein n=1 Tax=Kitasatospora sp. NPDC101801 TaxID=3364103 RepID=UPI003801C6C3